MRIGVTTGWRCLEIGAGNGSLSQWLARRVGTAGHVIATDIRTDLMEGIAGDNLEVRKFDVVHDEPPGAPYDLIAIRALLHHLPERRAVVSRMARWLKPGGWLFVQEPDFYPTWTVEPPPKSISGSSSLNGRNPRIDYYVGRKTPAWLQAEGLLMYHDSEGTMPILYNGGSESADCGLNGIPKRRNWRSEGGVSRATLDEFFRLYRDPTYWTTTIAFTATTAKSPRRCGF